jgi:glycosyltransferase involved in cell wall biosynthesis
MTDRPPISFLVPAFNCAPFLPEAIRSILDGNLGDNDEIVIVDDASTDTTPTVIEALAADEPRIRTVRHRFNRGSAAAGRNTAIEHANHALFLALDADNLLEPGSVAKLMSFMVEQAATAAAFGEVRFFQTNGHRRTHSWLYPGEITLADALAGHQWPGPDGNYLFTKESWLAAGRYDESVGGGIDSWAFGIRQLATGTRMVTLPGTHYLHRWGHESAWIRDAKLGPQSLKALRVLLPHLELLDEDSVEYLFSPQGRGSWFERLTERPLRLRGTAIGEAGRVVRYSPGKASIVTRLRSYLQRKFSGRQ